MTMNRRRFSMAVIGAVSLQKSHLAIADEKDQDHRFEGNFGSQEFWDEHRVTLGDSREKFDAAFEDAFLEGDDLGASYRFPDDMSISVDFCPDTNQAETIFIAPYDFFARDRRKDEEPRFNLKQADTIVRLMSPEDRREGRKVEDREFGLRMVGTSQALRETVEPETYEWVDNTPMMGYYTVNTFWSFLGDGWSDANRGGREENIELIVLTLKVD